VKKGRTVKLGVSTYSEMVAVDAIVPCFQSTPNFPSWRAERSERAGGLALGKFNLRVRRSSRKVMKINLSFATLAMTGSGEIERPVEKSRPTSWLVQRMRC